MDAKRQNLCAAHCDASHQSLDTAAAPQVAPFIASQLALVLPADASMVVALAAPANSIPQTRTTAPPLAIQHCCFRI